MKFRLVLYNRTLVETEWWTYRPIVICSEFNNYLKLVFCVYYRSIRIVGIVVLLKNL